MSGNAKVERTRTFTGCRTCRSRHAKCDEAQPECGTCRRLGLACGGYGARLFWITDDPALRPEQQQSHRGSEYRYPLFSELERRIMSIELSESLNKKTALDLLADIDSASEKFDSNGRGPTGLSKGPFGVFQALEPAVEPAAEFSVPSSSPDHPVSSIDSDFADGLVDEEIQRQDWSQQIGEANLDLFVNSLDPSLAFDPQDGASPGQLLMSDISMSNFLPSGAGDDHMSMFSPGFMSRAIGNTAITNDGETNQDSSHHREITPMPSRALTQGHGGGFSLPEYAEPLLRYYKQHIDGATTTLQAKRTSPWQMIFLPCALETFAELSLWSGASHTRSTILYTLLAHSAFQLHSTNKPNGLSNHWRDVGVRHQEKAQLHLRNALQLEMFGNRQAKYKELLMAILAMAMTSLYNGAHAFKIFLLDAERLIRLRGLLKQKSFKIRILHHMYTHLRVISESVSICSEPVAHGNNQGQITDNRTFRIGEESLNIGLDSTQEKSDDIGYNDIHLEIQGRWKETLYPVIYGIPESLMTLLSQTISFANEKSRLEAAARNNSKLSTDLNHHVKTLERSIWSWSLPPEPMGPPRPDEMIAQIHESLIDHPQARLMALAVHQALVIYFYRRVYNMNAMILQDLVRKTLNYLEPCMDEMVDDQDFATSLAWPAFIAACEAVSPDLQEKALKYLSATDNRGVYFTPKPARDIVSRIWERRENSNDWTMSWPSVMIEALP
ncbi:Fc.00g058330.m01.CDS01 [Cosmosporella sp. VM-42]